MYLKHYMPFKLGTPRVPYAGCANMYLKHYMPFKLFVNTRHARTQRNETKPLRLPVIKSNTRRRNVIGGVIEDVRSHQDILCNVVYYLYGVQFV